MKIGKVVPNKKELPSFIAWLISFESYSFVNILYTGLRTDLDIPQTTTSNFTRMIHHLSPITGCEPISITDLTFLKKILYPNIFTIVIVDESTQFDWIWNCWLLRYYLLNSKVLLISEDRAAIKPTETLVQVGVTSLVVIALSEFGGFYGKPFLLYDPFCPPNAKYFFSPSLKHPFVDESKNWCGLELPVLCPHEIPNCIHQSWEPRNFSKSSGIMLNILMDFKEFINCTLKISLKSHFKIKAKNFNNRSIFPEIMAESLFAPPFNNTIYDFEVWQSFSYPLDMLHLFIAVPSPKPIRSSIYPFKPFSFGIWVSIAAFIVYSTILISRCHLDNIATDNNNKIDSFSIGRISTQSSHYLIILHVEYNFRLCNKCLVWSDSRKFSVDISKRSSYPILRRYTSQKHENN